MKKLLLIISVFLLFIPDISSAAGTCGTVGGVTGTSPYTAETHSYADVADCVLDVAAGSEVIVPAGDGSHDWAGSLEITKALTLTGPGSARLTIKNTNASATAHIIRLNPTDYTTDQTMIVTGFTFDTNGKYGMVLGDPQNAPFGKQTKTRIHHNTFIDSTVGSGKAIYNRGSLYGVVDNNTFTDMWFPIEHHGGDHIADWWNPANTAQSTFVLGSADYMYFEDNTFDAGNNTVSTLVVSNGQYSSRFVFRYNYVLPNTTLGSYNLWELHGTNVAHTMEPCFGAEIYGNQVTVGNANVSDGFFKQRAGKTRIFYNQYTTGNGSTSYYLPYNDDPAGGYDSCPLASGTATPASKLTQDSYWWGNWNIRLGVSRLFLTDATMYATGSSCDGVTGFPRYGRDVFADYTPYSSENSPVDIHVTCGTLANIPATCTTGQGYWATNQSCTDISSYVGTGGLKTKISGTLYKCTATNTWTAYYTPYAYPHPLRGEFQCPQGFCSAYIPFVGP